MKVLLAQFNHSGGEYLYRLAEALSKEHRVSVLATERARDDSDLLDTESPPFSVTYIDGTDSQSALMKRSLNPRTFLSIKHAVESFDPDVVHVINEFFWNGVLIPLLEEYPFFITVHEPSFRTRHTNRGFQTLYYRARFPLNRQIRKYADGLFVHGPDSREELSQDVPSERIWTIPHGQYTSFLERSDGTTEEERAVLFFGLLRDDKGLEHLIRAEPKVRAKLDDARFIIAGQGDIERYEREMAAPDRFEIHNEYVNDDQAAQLFERAAVIACPYTEATQSGVIASAYPFGKPVVATAVGNIPTQIDHGRTGFLVPPADPDALADRIVELLSDDSKREWMGEAAREKAKTDLSWDRIASLTTTAYESAVSNVDRR